MTNIFYIKDDILNSKSRYIYHPCGINGKSFNVIFDKYPFAEEQFLEILYAHPMPLASVQSVKCRDTTVLNSFVYANEKISFDAVAQSLETIEDIAYGKTISFCTAFFDPKDWFVIEALIESRLKTVKPFVYYS